MLTIFDDMTQVTEAEVQRMLVLVDKQRREEALRYKHLFGQFACLKSWLMLEELLKPLGINNMEMDKNEHGKPYLPGHPEVHFSISHCKEAAGCLVADRPCGLDIERIRKAKDDLVRHTMNPEEAESIFASPFPDIAFTSLWTQKEAVLKLKGTGIVDDLHSALMPGNQQGIELQTVENTWKGYVYSVAIQK